MEMKIRKMVFAALGGTGIFGGFFLMAHKKDQEIKKWFRTCQKDERMLKVYSYWMMHKGSYAGYLSGLGIKKIIVYGIGYLGKSLIDELEHSNVKVLYAVDVNPAEAMPGLKVVPPSEIKEGADTVIITAISSYEEIKKNIGRYIKCPIVSIEDVIYHMMK